MTTETQWQQSSNQALAREIRPLLEEAYGPLPASDAWLTQLVGAIRGETETMADAVALAAWAFEENPALTEEAATALESEAARPVLVRLVAELARIVLLHEATASQILRHLQHHFVEEHDWAEEVVKAPIRAALTGRRDGPPLAAVMALLGRERCMRRIAAHLR